MKRKYLQVDHEANFYAEYAIAIPPTSQKKQWEKKKELKPKSQNEYVHETACRSTLLEIPMV